MSVSYFEQDFDGNTVTTPIDPELTFLGSDIVKWRLLAAIDTSTEKKGDPYDLEELLVDAGIPRMFVRTVLSRAFVYTDSNSMRHNLLHDAVAAIPVGMCFKNDWEMQIPMSYVHRFNYNDFQVFHKDILSMSSSWRFSSFKFHMIGTFCVLCLCASANYFFPGSSNTAFGVALLIAVYSLSFWYGDIEKAQRQNLSLIYQLTPPHDFITLREEVGSGKFFDAQEQGKLALSG